MHIKYKGRGLLGPSCLVLFILTITALLCPNVQSSAQAVENQTADVPTSAGGDSLSIAISNSRINFLADPLANDGIVKSTTDIKAKTTNETGYTLKISTPNTAMQSNDSSTNATIPTLSSATALGNFPDNRWGYYFSSAAGGTNSQFQPFSTTAVQIDTTTEPNTTLRTRKLTVASKIGTSLPTGTYSAQIVLSVITNAPLWNTTITNMQEMSSSVCASLPERAEGQLTDTRDGQKYYVGKMKDGKCWMLQNLALGSTTTTIRLTSSDSDVSSSFTLPRSSTTPTSMSTDKTNIQSWNLGKYVLATPELQNQCTGDPVAFSDCAKVGFVDVSSSSFEPMTDAETKKGLTGRWQGLANTTDKNTTTKLAVKCTQWNTSVTPNICTAGKYDPHYLVGNYYTLRAATANTYTSESGKDAARSICPKGWRLPSYGNGTTTNDYYTLTAAYGINEKSPNGAYSISGDPVRFVRGGNLYHDSKHISGAGQWGNYWMSTYSPEYTGNWHYFGFNEGAVHTRAYTSDTNNAYSVRCVAK